jgi:hypothetical protein
MLEYRKFISNIFFSKLTPIQDSKVVNQSDDYVSMKGSGRVSRSILTFLLRINWFFIEGAASW